MIQAGFYILTLIMIVLISLLVRKSQNPGKTILIYTSIVVIWIVYITLMSRSGILVDMGLPPKVPLLVVLPILVTIIVVITRKSFTSVLNNNSLHLPIYFQSFRIFVELLIFFAAQKNIFPKLATVEGLNFDIVTGLSAIAFGLFIQKNPKQLNLLLGWNIMGLLILALTIFSFVYSYYFGDFLKLNPAFEFVQLPYLFLPAVLMPCAVFLHLFSIGQILLKKKSV